MANEEHLKILKQGVEVWNRWREENPGIRPNLKDANISRANLSKINLKGSFLIKANLSGSNLTKANLKGSSFIRAYLIGTDLTEADLSDTDLGEAFLMRANLTGANLTGAGLHLASLTEANLTRADLVGAEFMGTELDSVDFCQAILAWTTTFGNVDLSTAKGLDNVVHSGPAIVNMDTIVRSKGKIPDVFLQGCGLSDLDIEYAKLHNPDLTKQEITDITHKISNLLISYPFQYYSCFISYSSQDETFAQRLYADLQQKGVRCWFAPEDMKIGDKIRSTIDQSIRGHDKLLLILSENSINSTWVETEVEKALAEERRRKQTILFPVRLDETVKETEEAWAAEIHDTRHIGDFSRWKDHDAYQQAFERLLRDLQAEGENK